MLKEFSFIGLWEKEEEGENLADLEKDYEEVRVEYFDEGEEGDEEEGEEERTINHLE